MPIKGVLASALIAAAACGGSSSGGGGSQQLCGGQTLPATFEAKDAQLQGVQVTPQGYVTGFGAVGEQVTFHVCAPESGYYTVDFSYAKGTDGVATRTLLVDGTAYPGSPMFPPLWTFNTWASGGRRALHLRAGNHTIALAFQQSDGGGEIWLDRMVLSSGPSDSGVSVRSLLMNNWKDLVVGWHAAKLYPKDDKGFGPRMTAFHWGKDWPTNQINEAQAFFRDDTANTPYTDTKQFDTTARFTASDSEGYGEMRVDYGDYGGKALPMSITRRMIAPPGQDFVVVLYDIGNVTDASRQYSILEWADLHNKTEGASEDQAEEREFPLSPPGQGGTTMNATWYPQYNAWIADMSQTNGVFLVMGAFGPMDHHVAGAPVTGGPDNGAATVQQFAGGSSSLGDADSFSGKDVGIGVSKTIALDSNRSTEIGFFYGIADSLDGAKALAASAETAGSPGTSVAQSSSQWKAWLSSTKAAALKPPVSQWSQALQVALVTNRQLQQPEFGSFVASSNPAYHYKVWARDSSVVAMSFDAAGFLDDAERFWNWMAQVQSDGSDAKHPVGSWWTNYSFFAKNQQIPFVEPEFDAVGLFLIGAYRHYEALKPVDAARAARFLDAVWPAVQKAAAFIRGAVVQSDNHGFGAADFSIWEEKLEYAVFTQTTYASGLHAAQLLALERQDASSAQAWSEASDTVGGAISRDTSAAPCPGAWYGSKSYFIRGVWPDCSLDARVDASTGLLWVFGLLPAMDPRATQHRQAILGNLVPGQFGYGISRYEGDEFYHSNPDSPGGAGEANGSMPVWPQMSMYMAMLEHWLGMDDLATDRLSWYVATTSAGYQPVGEAVDWTTERPLTSTASEPVTGAWYVLALLDQLGEFEPRLP